MTKANSKRNKGLHATGVGAVACACHETFRRMANLLRGERYVGCATVYLCFLTPFRYVNMDYVLLSELKQTQVKLAWISYDIACQWSLNLFRRIADGPDRLRPAPDLVMNFLIPKFHLVDHIPACHGNYSFNYAPGVGRTDGEAIERLWAWLNGIARCVSMMTPSGRFATLDDFCNFYNFRKTLHLGILLPELLPTSCLTVLRSGVATTQDESRHQRFDCASPGFLGVH